MLKLHLIILIQEAKHLSPVDSFSGGFANKFQGAFNKTVLPECLVNKRLHFNSKSHEGPKIKGGSFDMAEQVAGVV
jgi:hypothetical protein